MSIFKIIILVVGFGLLILGSSSAYVLFKHSFRIGDRFGDEINVASMWALFIFSLLFGLLFIWWALPSENII